MNLMRDTVLKMRLVTAFGVPQGRGECAWRSTGVQGAAVSWEKSWEATRDEELA